MASAWAWLRASLPAQHAPDAWHGCGVAAVRGSPWAPRAAQRGPFALAGSSPHLPLGDPDGRGCPGPPRSWILDLLHRLGVSEPGACSEEGHQHLLPLLSPTYLHLPPVNFPFKRMKLSAVVYGESRNQLPGKCCLP